MEISPDSLHSTLGCGAISIWIKVAYTIYICILVPVYWRHYGPANFLWFSDVALFVALIALWLQSPLLASMQAVSVLLPDVVWLVDFVTRLVLRVEVTALTKYMFRRDIPLVVRGLSLFHVWLPLLLLWMVHRLGYDPRAWMAQSLLASVILTLCYCFTDRSANINWVFGPWGKPQSWMPASLYLMVVIASFSFCIYLPTHLVLLATMPVRP